MLEADPRALGLPLLPHLLDSTPLCLGISGERELITPTAAELIISVFVLINRKHLMVSGQ